MFELRVPIITIVTNKGGSGKTLAVGCANKWLMLENSAFYVARSLCCNIMKVFTSNSKGSQLKITTQEHYRLWIAYAIIPGNIGIYGEGLVMSSSAKETMFSLIFRRRGNNAKHKIVADKVFDEVEKNFAHLKNSSSSIIYFLCTH
ncbi:hypothetical protein H5410_037546 [Solanum commersonii]|uniref:Uncharacterized protein n=1 Tax=Solanum commersonii TaxID=4109 RepID=A0A9J5Y8A7_SOLCO|nr:hypothetical protein H5410_037546 [Solanum commersonii]